MTWIKRTEGCDLPLQVRIAWSAWIAEHTLNHYSSYFRKKYFQSDAIELAWAFALGITDPQADHRQIRCRISELYEDAEEEGYSIESLAVGDELMLEIEQDDGKSAVAAVEYAAASLSNAVVYACGTHICNPAVGWNYREAIVNNVLEVAGNAFRWAKKNNLKRANHNMFNEFALPTKFPPLQLDAQAKDQFPPPKHEAGRGACLTY